MVFCQECLERSRESKALEKSIKVAHRGRLWFITSSIMRLMAKMCSRVPRSGLKPFWLILSRGSTCGLMRLSNSRFRSLVMTGRIEIPRLLQGINLELPLGIGRIPVRSISGGANPVTKMLLRIGRSTGQRSTFLYRLVGTPSRLEVSLSCLSATKYSSSEKGSVMIGKGSLSAILSVAMLSAGLKRSL